MALANIAVLLAQAGRRVLAIDWDLEAPGLDRYLRPPRFAVTPARVEGAGLLDLLSDSMASHEAADWRRYTTEVELGDSKYLTLLSCGMQDQRYAGRVLDFNWENFFKECEGGEIIESWRREWLDQFDITLIDSRTGITDSGGVCTIQLPDIVVPVFTTNDQSLGGAIETVRQAQTARQRLAFDRAPFTVMPLPSRFDGRVQYQEGQEWLRRFASELHEFYVDWLPREIPPLQMLERTKIPYVAFFSFGERLPVLDEGTTDSESIGYAYAVAAKLIGSELLDALSVARFGISADEARDAEDVRVSRPARTSIPLASSHTDLSQNIIYLAKASVDMRSAYERLYRELELRGYVIVPAIDDEIPRDAGARATVRRNLDEASLSVHLLGLSGGYTPNDESQAIVPLQLTEAALRVSAQAAVRVQGVIAEEGFRRIIWAPKTVVDADGATIEVRDPLAVLDKFDAMNPGDLVDGSDLSTFVDMLLQHLSRRPSMPLVTPQRAGRSVFIMHAAEDVEFAIEVATALQNQSIESIFPIFDGPRHEVDRWNRTQIKESGSVAVCWGNVSEVRVRAMLQDTSALRRAGDIVYSGLIIGPPPTDRKRFAAEIRPRDVDVVVDLTTTTMSLSEALEQVTLSLARD